jgi:hypothetical protein
MTVNSLVLPEVRRIELKRYNGQWNHRGVVERIRRKLTRSISQGECVLLDGEDVVGLKTAVLRAMVDGLPRDKLRLVGFPAFQPYPLPGDENV